jgi:hypothetical protein
MRYPGYQHASLPDKAGSGKTSCVFTADEEETGAAIVPALRLGKHMVADALTRDGLMKRGSKDESQTRELTLWRFSVNLEPLLSRRAFFRTYPPLQSSMSELA